MVKPCKTINIAQIFQETQRFYRFFSPKSETRALYPTLYNIFRDIDFEKQLLLRPIRAVTVRRLWSLDR